MEIKWIPFYQRGGVRVEDRANREGLSKPLVCSVTVRAPDRGKPIATVSLTCLGSLLLAGSLLRLRAALNH